MASVQPTPEVETIPSLLAHPLLQDKKFLAAALVLFLSLVLFSGELAPRARSSRRCRLLICAAWRPSGKARGGRRSGTPTVLLVGPSDAGKTALFAQLSQNVYPPTHTSVQSSTATVPLASPDEPSVTKPVKLVDLPGHPRLRDEIHASLPDASAVVFVVDIAAVVRNAAAVAEQIPPLLTSLAAAASRNAYSPPRVLFLAHKADLLVRPQPPSSPSPPDIPQTTKTTATERLRSILTREMDRLKSARSTTSGKIEGMGKVAGTGSSGLVGKIFGGGAGGVAEDSVEGEEDETLIWGGRGPFKWEDVEGVEIEWAASGLGAVQAGRKVESTVTEETEAGDGLDDLKRFILEA
ncbi:signal recognition particle receptor beta subunit-domain-containing protein [Papiliotrema laurentii]|uniref:Signal recognition particle receptor subunit beta n=1 Tax=Papiliotrema laurentii TaxID=5418 RepID=A0AAD9FRB5_PAPLA|nr:signal recognition particle receptor beta subunit-domain-containing protein [Papiliotrema laurentii]